jgi:hypothetical protein
MQMLRSMTGRTKDGEMIGPSEEASDRTEPGRKQVLSSAASRIYASQVGTSKYIQCTVGRRFDKKRRVEAIGRGDLECIQLVNRESCATQRAASSIIRARERGSQNMPGISRRWIRITGEQSRFVMMFKCSSRIFRYLSRSR